MYCTVLDHDFTSINLAINCIYNIVHKYNLYNRILFLSRASFMGLQITNNELQSKELMIKTKAIIVIISLEIKKHVTT